MGGGDGVEKTEQRAMRKKKQADLVTGEQEQAGLLPGSDWGPVAGSGEDELSFGDMKLRS